MACEIRIYDKDFNWVGTVKNAESIQFTRSFYGIGGFEIHIHPEKNYAGKLCQRGNFIIINGNMEKMGIIRYFTLNESRDGASISVFGDTVKGFANQRIIIPPTKTENPLAYGWDRISGNAETVIKHYLKRSLTNSSISGRNIPFIEIAEDLGRGQTAKWQARYQNLGEVIQEIAEMYDIGWKAYFDPERKMILYDINEGTDRTLSQTENSPVTFKLEYSNIGEYSYTEDFSNFRTTGICGGSGEDENRLIYTLGGEAEGAWRFEEFLDCGNAKDITELIHYGEQKLSEFKEIKHIEADALPRAFIFEEDFFLGDKVSVYIGRINSTEDTRITEVKEIWERDSGYSYEIKFGYDLPNIYTALKPKAVIR